LRCEVGLEGILCFLATAASLVTLIILMLVLDLDKQLPNLDEYVLKNGLLRCLVDLLHESPLVAEAHAVVPRCRSGLSLLLSTVSASDYFIDAFRNRLLQMLDCVDVLLGWSFGSVGQIDGVQFLGPFRSGCTDSTNGDLHFDLAILLAHGLRTDDLGVVESTALLDLAES
jgi:hypothetical protein